MIRCSPGIGSTLIEIARGRGGSYPPGGVLCGARARSDGLAGGVDAAGAAAWRRPGCGAAVSVPRRRLIILSRDADSPAAVAQLLVAEGYGDSMMTVLGDLGADSESRTESVARDWQGQAPALNVVCVACAGTGRAASLAPGLPDEAFDHDGQLTKRDLRASALAHLMPGPGELLWDVGAGAASIAIEWLRSDPGCRAIAIDHNLDRCKRIRGNAEALGVPGLDVLHAEVPDALSSLPQPDAIFVGGGATSRDARTVVVRLAARRPAGGSCGNPGVGDDHDRILEALRR